MPKCSSRPNSLTKSRVMTVILGTEKNHFGHPQEFHAHPNTQNLKSVQLSTRSNDTQIYTAIRPVTNQALKRPMDVNGLYCDDFAALCFE